MKRKDIEIGECPICHKQTRLRLILGKKKIFICKKCRPYLCV